MDLEELNRLASAEFLSRLQRCCGSPRWAARMEERRPFRSRDELFQAADETWFLLGHDDWREAFSHHPQIGDTESLRSRFASTRSWSEGEQTGVAEAPDEILENLARLNRLYQDRYGYIFIVCATGKSAGEMLSLLEDRLGNPADAEIEKAAREQSRITHLRLQKLLE